jgi:transcriptional regulator with XRE-family HTH domain
VDGIPAWDKTVPMAEKTNFFREHRKHKGLTQEGAAAQIGIDRSYLSKLETGKEPYNQAFLEAAAKVYHCAPHDLLSRNPAAPSLVNEFRELPLDLQEQLLEIARTFKRKVG